MARSARGSLFAPHEPDSGFGCRTVEEIHAADGSGSRVSVAEERTGAPAAVSSTGTAREGARAGGLSRLCAAGDPQASAQAQRFGILTGSSAEAARGELHRPYPGAGHLRPRDTAGAKFETLPPTTQHSSPLPT